jgi:uncharacterized protein (TIGR00269 family)
MKGGETKKCRKCRKRAVVSLKTYKISLCDTCFPPFFERLVERDVKKYKIIKEDERVLAAVSGGKDSVALLSTLKAISSSLNFHIEALHIDLGIGEYSRKSTEICKKLCQELEIELNTVKLAEYGFTISDVSTKKVCSVCGNAKRYIFNRFARENGFDVIATGHNADDILANFFKNWLSGNRWWIEKQSPRTEGFDRVITRIRPLFLRTEKENAIYVLTRHLPFLADECPNAPQDRWKEIIYEIEAKIPGFKQNFVRNMFKEKKEVSDFRYCSICGEVSTSEICQFCRNIMKYGKNREA